MFGLAPSARFCSATFGAGVVAAQRPITCPKRQLQPERYAQFGQIVKNFIEKTLDRSKILDTIRV
jgi:hypothetical protein